VARGDQYLSRAAELLAKAEGEADFRKQAEIESVAWAYLRLADWAKRQQGGAIARPPMAIHKLIANGSFGPDEIEVMKAAYEAALVDVGVADPDDPITDLIAKSIVNVTASGERNPKEVMERALNALGVRRPAVVESQNSPAVEEDYRGARSGSGSRAP